MPDIAAQFAAGIQQATEALGSPALYVRCETGAAIFVDVVLASPNYQVAETSGFMLSAETWELLIVASDLVDAGETIEPAVGDTIKIGTTTYTALLPDGARNCWTWADRFQTRRRIYVKVTRR